MRKAALILGLLASEIERDPTNDGAKSAPSITSQVNETQRKVREALPVSETQRLIDEIKAAIEDLKRPSCEEPNGPRHKRVENALINAQKKLKPDQRMNINLKDCDPNTLQTVAAIVVSKLQTAEK